MVGIHSRSEKGTSLLVMTNGRQGLRACDGWTIGMSVRGKEVAGRREGKARGDSLTGADPRTHPVSPRTTERSRRETLGRGGGRWVMSVPHQLARPARHAHQCHTKPSWISRSRLDKPTQRAPIHTRAKIDSAVRSQLYTQLQRQKKRVFQTSRTFVRCLRVSFSLHDKKQLRIEQAVTVPGWREEAERLSQWLPQVSTKTPIAHIQEGDLGGDSQPGRQRSRHRQRLRSGPLGANRHLHQALPPIGRLSRPRKERTRMARVMRNLRTSRIPKM